MSESIHYLGDTVDKCPYDYYAEARAREAVTWEEPTKNWIAASYNAVRDVLTDEDTFARPLPTVPKRPLAYFEALRRKPWVSGLRNASAR